MHRTALCNGQLFDRYLKIEDSPYGHFPPCHECIKKKKSFAIQAAVLHLQGQRSVSDLWIVVVQGTDFEVSCM